MPAVLIKTLLKHLPRYAEEEGDFYAVAREDLIKVLCAEHSINHAIAENTVAMCETLLDTFAVLNPTHLQHGDWCFVSFPAQLLAMSLLTAWCDKDSRFFAANFWQTQGISNDKKDKQRDVLHAIESQRVVCHATQNAPPIRYIYVAWSIIKLDGKVLFHQREDTKKRHDDKAGDYVLIGGRLNQHDSADFARDNIGYLQQLQSNNAAFIEQDLPKTLARELKEETGLIYKTHYDFKLWRKLKPYRQVEGTAPNHAFTEYYLTLYSIELTLAGYVWLHDKIKTDEQLVWFSMAAIENGKTADGKKPYIKALVDDFSGDLTALTAELIKLPDSFTASYLAQINEPNNYALILPINTEQPLLMGVKGKEKPLPVSLTAEQLALLLGLAAHNRGFVFADVAENIRFHPFGWVDVANNAVLKNELIQLAALFKNTALCIENHQDTLFRLSINPAVIYVTETVFIFSVQGADLNATKTKIAVTISRQALVTAFGVTQAHAQTFNITLDLAHNLQKLAQQSFLADNVTALKIEDACKKKLHKDPNFLALGLRALIRRDAGLMTFCCPFVVV